VLKSSTQKNLVQNNGTLSLHNGFHEAVFAKAGYRGTRFSGFDRSGAGTEFFNTIGSMRQFAALGTKGCFS